VWEQINSRHEHGLVSDNEDAPTNGSTPPIESTWPKTE